MNSWDVLTDHLLKLLMPYVEKELKKRKLKISAEQKTDLVIFLLREFRVRQQVIDWHLNLIEMFISQAGVKT